MNGSDVDMFLAITDLAAHQPIPAEGILTRTIHDAPHVKVVLFTFSTGQELSEHTAAMPAMMHFVSGEADVKLGERHIKAGPGTWVHMSSGCPHSIRTRTPVVMLLVLVKQQRSAANG